MSKTIQLYRSLHGVAEMRVVNAIEELDDTLAAMVSAWGAFMAQSHYSPFHKGKLHPEHYYCDACGNREDLGHLDSCGFKALEDLMRAPTVGASHAE